MVRASDTHCRTQASLYARSMDWLGEDRFSLSAPDRQTAEDESCGRRFTIDRTGAGYRLAERASAVLIRFHLSNGRLIFAA